MQFHVCTFHKCASNWTRRLFRSAADHSNANIWVDNPNDSPVNKSVDRDSPRTLCLYRNGNRRNFNARAAEGEKVVLCIRDPKDVAVSQYWSWKETHSKNNKVLLQTRETLNALSVKDGVLHLIDNRLVRFPEEVRGWTDDIGGPNVSVLRYEDLLTSFSASYSAAIEFLGLEPMSPETISQIKEKYSFNSLAGRKPGDEDVKSHYRRGVSGDWANYFDDEIAAAFDREYGALCDALGYERATAPKR